MGEVYSARDTVLKRDVAVKVLPAALASDPDRMARFRREAELLASLNHPNVAIVHGLVEWEGQRALVMELVSGETLSDRISRGAMYRLRGVAYRTADRPKPWSAPKVSRAE